MSLAMKITWDACGYCCYFFTGCQPAGEGLVR